MNRIEFPLVIMLMLLVVGNLQLSAQNGDSYRIENFGDYDQDIFKQALDRASLDTYRNLETDRLLFFENGAEVTLFPCKYLTAKGIKVNTSAAIAKKGEIDINNTFILNRSGYILERINATPIKK